MSDRDALLAAIIANPDDDTARLVYADWLQENGDSDRAEFIRVQCELARLRAAEADLPQATRNGYNSEWPVAWRPQDTQQRIALLQRESALLSTHSANEWRNGLPKCANNATTWQEVRFRRGFVGHAAVPIGPFTKAPAALWAQHPVESILLTYSGGNDRRKIPKCLPLAALRELQFLNNNGDGDTLAPYAECPHLSALQKFNLGQAAITDDGAAVLSRSPHLRPVELELDCSTMSAKWFAGLLGSRFASRLRCFTPKGLPAGGSNVLADAPLGALRRLDLQRRSLDDEGVAWLTRSSHLTRLVTLDLSNNELTDAALETLAAWPGLASVRVLNLSDNRDLTGRGLAALLASPHLRPIYLGLWWTRTGDDGAKALAAWTGLADLVGLSVSYAEVGNAGAAALARSPHWRDIRDLRLRGGHIERDTLALLSERIERAGGRAAVS